MRRVFLIVLILAATVAAFGQQAYTIDNSGAGDYSSFADAINFLNGAAIPENGIIFNVIAGQEFMEKPPVITAIGSEIAPIVFQKSGDGSNPVIKASPDGENMLEFEAARFITFDGIDITDSDLTDELRIEIAVYVNASENINILNSGISNFTGYGVHLRYESKNITIDNCSIYNEDNYISDMGSIYGICGAFNSEADNFTITNNKLYGLTSGTTVYGIRVTKVKSDIINNFVSITKDNTDKVYAMRLDAGLAGLVINAYNNTIYMAGTATDHGYALYRTGTDGEFNIYNNIFINNRTGAFDHYVVANPYVAGVWNADYNVYYTENGALADWGGVDCTDLAAFQAATENDANAISKDINFISGTDLHIAGESLGDTDLAGLPLEAVPTDIDGEARHITHPYRGADENTEHTLAPGLMSEYIIDNTGAGDLQSIGEAAQLLNSSELPEGGVVFHITAGQQFAEEPIHLISIGSESAPVSFIKYGEGDNPVILNNTHDAAAFQMDTCAYITIDGVDITDELPADENQFETAIYIYNSSNITIENCNISDFAKYGIYQKYIGVDNVFHNNTLFSTQGFMTGSSSIYGIYISYNSESDNITVTNNNIYGFHNVSSTITGIRVWKVNSSIINNTISITADTNDQVRGIRLDSGANVIFHAYHNTVFITGTPTDDGDALFTSGGESTSWFHIKNNIFINNRDHESEPQRAVWITFNGANFDLDNNVYYCGAAETGFSGRWLTTEIADFDTWQSSSELDTFSVVTPVEFTDPVSGDMHIAGSSIGEMNLGGVYLEMAALDIDGEQRNTTRPYIGADENTDYPLNYSLTADTTPLDFGSINISETSDVLAFSITNSGSSSALIDSITVPTGYELSWDGSLWLPIIVHYDAAPGENTIYIRFEPPQIGDYTGECKIYADRIEQSPAIINLSGQGVSPEIDLDIYGIDFGNIAVGSISPEQVKVIRNIGNAPLLISSMSFSDNYEARLDGQESWVSLIENTEIVPDDSIVVEIRFLPEAEQDYQGLFIISCNDFNESYLEIALVGTGVAISPPLNMAATAGDGTVALSWDAPTAGRDLVGYNLYKETVEAEREYILLATQTGTTYTDDAVTNGTTYNYYTTALYTDPEEESPPSNVVSATPMHYEADIDVSEDSFDFGSIIVGHMSEPQMLIIHNNGNTGLVIGTITLPSGFIASIDGENYVQSLDCFEIEGADSLIMYLVYAPVNYYEQYGGFVISSNDPDQESLTISMHGKGIGVVMEEVYPNLPEIWHSKVCWGDYDKDGDLDLFLTGYGLAGQAGDGEAYIYRNDGDEVFTQIGIYDGVGNGIAAWVDYDNDDDLDVFMSGQIHMDTFTARFLNNDNGTFNPVETEDIPPLKGGNCDWQDFDLDGDADLLIVGAENVEDGDDINHTDIYINDGSGGFGLMETGMTAVASGACAWADYDKDGDLDVAITGSAGSYYYVNKIYRNDNNLSFTDLQVAEEGLRYSDISWVDYDNDGDLDVVAGGSYDNDIPSVCLVYRNEGFDDFTEIDLGIKGVRQGDSEMGDLDNDGDMDLVVNGINNMEHWPGYIYIQENPDEWVLVDSIVSLKYCEVELADYDNDNSLDILISGRYDYQAYVCALFRNEMPNTNTPPSAPDGLAAEVDENSVLLSWETGEDEETPDYALTYNLRIGTAPGLDDVFECNADTQTGFRELITFGNMGHKKEISIPMIPNAGTYYWSVQTIDNSFKGSVFADEGQFEITVQDIQNAYNMQGKNISGLLGNYPNPFNPITAISYSLEVQGMANLSIYNVKGQLVRKLVNSEKPAGTYSVIWDGKDSSGSQVSSGVYFYRLETGNKIYTNKMMVIK